MRNKDNEIQLESLNDYKASPEMDINSANNNSKRGFDLLTNPPKQDTRLMEYIGKSPESILEEFPDGKIEVIEGERSHSKNITFSFPAGELLFIFDDNDTCKDALFFSNEDE